MLSCRQIVEQSSQYLDHEMSFSHRLHYRIHLLMCRHCRRFTQQFKAAAAMTKQLETAPVTADQIDAMKQRIDRLA